MGGVVAGAWFSLLHLSARRNPRAEASRRRHSARAARSPLPEQGSGVNHEAQGNDGKDHRGNRAFDEVERALDAREARTELFVHDAPEHHAEHDERVEMFSFTEGASSLTTFLRLTAFPLMPLNLC